MSENYKFFSNDKCEYFPCHKVNNPENFNCLFCYCPLYALKENCGGNFKYTSNGIKDKFIAYFLTFCKLLILYY